MPKLYTKQGDTGKSSLYNGDIISKTSMYFEILGDLDEVSSHIGMLCCLIFDNEILEFLRNIQLKLIDVSSEIATPPSATATVSVPNAISDSDIQLIEKEIDEYSGRTSALTEFIITGTSTVDAQCNICRSVTRRAERHMWSIDTISPNIMKYINRLSDLFFALSRLVAPSEIKVSDLRRRGSFGVV
jgi:cob(I)alamin adenosyltransferase